jgi:hypothetical protein
LKMKRVLMTRTWFDEEAEDDEVEEDDSDDED